jgi:hypothetical protein
MMVDFVIIAHTFENLDGFGGEGSSTMTFWKRRSRAESFSMKTTIFVQCGRTEHANLAFGQGWLEDIGGIHRAFGITGAHDVVQLVDDQDNVASLAGLIDDTFHATLKLAAELGAGHHGGHI